MLVGKMKDFYVSFNMVILYFSYKSFSFKISLPLHLLLNVMIMSFDTRVDYDVASEEHVTCG